MIKDVIMREIGRKGRARSRVSQEFGGVYRAGAFDTRELDQIRLSGLWDIHGPHPRVVPRETALHSKPRLVWLIGLINNGGVGSGRGRRLCLPPLACQDSSLLFAERERRTDHQH